MKSQKKRTLARKPRQKPKMLTDEQKKVLEEAQDGSSSSSDTIVLNSHNYGSTCYTYAGATVGGTITLPAYSSTVTSGGSSYTLDTSSWSSSYNYNPSVNITGDGITMKEGSDIKIGDKSLLDTITKLEERLAILKPNEALEDRWEQLKELRRQYMELEKELLEKEKMWEILKKS